jgi:hypothetical protein
LYHLQVQIDLYAKDIHFDGILMMVMMVKSLVMMDDDVTDGWKG